MISIAPTQSGFELRSDGEPCGPRLVKGDGFPLALRGADTFRFPAREEAEQAAGRLESYLAKHVKRK